MQPPEGLTEPIQSRNRRVLLIGASVRAAAASANLAGLQVFGIDKFLDSETRSACLAYWTTEQIRQMDDAQIQSLIPSDCQLYVAGGLPSDQDLVQRLSMLYPGSTRQLATMRELADPKTLSEISDQADVLFPEYQVDCERSPSTNERWIRKAVSSSGGLGIWWRDAAHKTDERCYDQRWIPGRAFGAVVLIDGSGNPTLLGVTRSLFTRLASFPFVYAGGFGPIAISDHVRNQLNTLSHVVHQRTGLTGLLNIDFLIDRGTRGKRFYLLEFNPRWSGSVEILETAFRAENRLCESTGGSVFGLLTDSLSGGRTADHVRCLDPLAVKSVDHSRVYKRVVFSRFDGWFDPSQLGRVLAGVAGKWQCVDTPVAPARVVRGEPLVTLLCEIPAKQFFDWRNAKRLVTSVQQVVSRR